MKESPYVPDLPVYFRILYHLLIRLVFAQNCNVPVYCTQNNAYQGDLIEKKSIRASSEICLLANVRRRNCNCRKPPDLEGNTHYGYHCSIQMIECHELKLLSTVRWNWKTQPTNLCGFVYLGKYIGMAINVSSRMTIRQCVMVENNK